MPRKKTNPPASQGSLFDGPAKSRTKKPTGKKKLNPIPPLPGKKRWLSATSLEAMRRCPRCFWLQINMKIYQPEGIVSRLANRFDGVIKKYFSLYRGTPDLPPLITGKIEGRLESPFQETYFVPINDRYGYMGKLDECLIDRSGKFVPVDFKTASSDPSTRELIPAYQFQLDSYAFLLDRNRKPPGDVGHLVYFYPGHGDNLHEGFPMEITIKTLQTEPSRVMPRINEALEILSGGLPKPAADCNFCKYVETVKEF